MDDYVECPICGVPMNGINGPENKMAVENDDNHLEMLCRSEEECSEVIEVCANNHRYHRGCILEWCHKRGFNEARCPQCRGELNCDYLETKPPVPVYKLERLKRGGRKHKKKTLKKRTRKNKKNHKKNTNKRR